MMATVPLVVRILLFLEKLANFWISSFQQAHCGAFVSILGFHNEGNLCKNKIIRNFSRNAPHLM
jgi:hypothetical protein